MGIIQLNDPYSSRSASLGRAAGSGLGNMLTGLANQHLQEYVNRKQSRKVAEGLSSIGIPEDVAIKVANLPAPLQSLFMKQFFGSEASSPQPQEGYESMLSGQETPQQQEQQQEQPKSQELQQLLGKEQQAKEIQKPIDKNLNNLISSLSPEGQQALKIATSQNMQPKEIMKKLPEKDQTLITKFKEKESGVKISPAGRNALKLQQKPTQKKTFRELLATPRPTAQDKMKAQEMLFKKEKLNRTEQKDIDSSTKESYTKIMSDAKDAQVNDMRLNRMKELNEKGSLTPAGISSLIDTVSKGIFGVGLNLKWMQTADSQEFDKLSKDFLKNAKAIFGARVTEGEIKMFLETIPTLSQTKGARSRIIRNMKMLNEAAKLRKKSMIDIIDMNNGERPKNMDMLIEKKIGHKLDVLTKAFSLGEPKEKSYSVFDL